MNQTGVGEVEAACWQCVELCVEGHRLTATAALRGRRMVPAVGRAAQAVPLADGRVDVGGTNEESLGFLAHWLRNELERRYGELRHRPMMSDATERNNTRLGVQIGTSERRVTQ